MNDCLFAKSIELGWFWSCELRRNFKCSFGASWSHCVRWSCLSAKMEWEPCYQDRMGFKLLCCGLSWEMAVEELSKALPLVALLQFTFIRLIWQVMAQHGNNESRSRATPALSQVEQLSYYCVLFLTLNLVTWIQQVENPSTWSSYMKYRIPSETISSRVWLWVQVTSCSHTSFWITRLRLCKDNFVRSAVLYQFSCEKKKWKLRIYFTLEFYFSVLM